jgi:hypothetical protein
LKYDTDSSNQINLGENQQAKITEALRRRRGVCENFAAIFNDITTKTGIRSYVVQGYTKQLGSIDKTGHSWVAVYIHNTWFFCDPTWDVSTGNNAKYFLIEPDEFIETHMPFDPLWQLKNDPISHEDFYIGNSRGSGYFNFKDSLEAYTQMDSLKKYKTIATRIERAGIKNNLLKNNLGYNKMQIEIINQDRDAELYNSAIELSNKAAAILNKFLVYRNERFLPEKKDEEIRNSLSGINALLSLAISKLDKIDKSEATFAISSEPVRERIKGLYKRTAEQLSFINHYLQSPVANRASLFYK